MACADYSACFCHAPVDPWYGMKVDASSETFFKEADRLREQTLRIADADCSTVRVNVIFPSYGLGGSLLDHLQRILMVWQPSFSSHAGSPVAAIPVPQYSHFPTNRGDTNAYLWAKFDDTLPCTSWFGCYWERLSTPCPSAAEAVKHNFTLPNVNSSAFERRWGSLLYSAALLRAWWRPTMALKQKIAEGVQKIFKGPGGSRNDVDADGDGQSGVSDEARVGGGCLALHIRRGDACATAWRHCPPLDEYLAVSRAMARRYGLTSLFVATEDNATLAQLHAATASASEPWGNRIHHQAFDRAPFSQKAKRASGSRFWVEQRLRYAQPGDRPLGRQPILQFLVDVEAASRCRALVGTMDSHGTRLMLLRMAARLGRVPPFYSLVAPSCPITKLPQSVAELCSNHSVARDWTSSATSADPGWPCPGLVGV